MLGGMKRRRILLVIVVAAVAAGLVLLWPRGPKEPVFQGKRLSQWLEKDFIHTGDMHSYEKAKQAIHAAGTNALPFFLYQFTVSESRLGAKFRRWLSSFSKGHLQIDPLRDRLTIASYGMRLMGSNAVPALPTLASYFDDPRRANYAFFAMGECGDAALPYALKAVSSTNSELAGRGATALADIARNNGSAIPPLIALLGHSNAGLQMWAAANLRGVKTHPDLTMPAWSNALSHSNGRMRLHAAQSLGELGPAARPVVPDLLRLTMNSNRALAQAASNAVFKLDPAALPPRGQ
jgi:hypothetical protein